MKFTIEEFGPKLEKWFRVRQLLPVDAFEHKGCKVYLAEGGPYYDRPSEYPNGWYAAAYAIKPGMTKGEVVSWLEFDSLHDLSFSNESRKQMRIKAAKDTAITIIDDFTGTMQ